MVRHDLRVRILVTYALGAVGLMVALGWFHGVGQRHLVRLWAKERLMRIAEALSERAVDSWSDTANVETLLQPVATMFRVRIAICDVHGNLRAALDAADFPHRYRAWVERVMTTGEPFLQVDDREGFSQQILGHPIKRGDEVLGVLLIAPASAVWPSESVWTGVLPWMVAATVLVIGGAVALWFQLRPVERLATLADKMVAGQAVNPLGLGRTDEVQRIYHALQQLQQGSRLGSDVLRHRTDLLWGVLHNMVEGVLAIAPDGRVELANEASGRMVGFAASHAMGKLLIEVTRCHELEEVIRLARQSRSPHQREFIAPGMPQRHLSARAAPLTGGPDGNILVVMHDVSELRRLENVRREFVANVSHELKTPLASISAYAETLRMGAIDDPQFRDKCLAAIEEQAKRLHQMIVDLLQLARIESGHEVLKFADVRLPPLVQDVVRSFAELATTKGVTLTADPQSPPLCVHADEDGLRTILNNLVDNAIKYTAPGGTVRVWWEQQSGYAVLAVEDTGIGISVKDQLRVFERFYRTDRARSRESGGTGLGLAIVKHLAQAMGGDVGVESREGVGSTFRVRLPLSSHQERMVVDT